MESLISKFLVESNQNTYPELRPFSEQRNSPSHSLEISNHALCTYHVYCELVFSSLKDKMSALHVSFIPVEILQGLVSGNLGGTLGPTVSSPIEQEGAVGPVSLPRRAETFGGFDSHQMNASKGK